MTYFGHAGHPAELVFYLLDGDAHSRQMMAVWSDFLRRNSGSGSGYLRDIGVDWRKTEASEARDEINKLGINGFPALVLLDGNGDKIERYQGERTADGFRSFLEKYAE